MPVGVPALLSVFSGNNQEAVLNTTFAAYCRVRCTDSTGAGIANVEIWYVCPLLSEGGPTGGWGPGHGNTQNLFTDSQGYTNGGNFLTALNFDGAWTMRTVVGGQDAVPALNAYFNMVNGSGTPASITSTGGSGQSAVEGAQFSAPLLATVKDINGTLLINVNVTFTLPVTFAAGGTFPGGLTSATSLTNASGVATSPSITANAVAGQWTATAHITANALLATNYTLTTLSNLVPTTLTLNSGSNQSATINTAFGAPISVTLRDQNSGVIVGAAIAFSVPGGASGTFAGGTPAFVNTNSSGIAVSPTLTANGSVGTWTGLAQVSSSGSISVAWGGMQNLQSVAPPEPTYINLTGGGSQRQIPGGVYTAVSVSVTDQYFNGIAANVTLHVPNTGFGTFPGNAISASITTNSAGNGTFPAITAGATLGAFGVTTTGATTTNGSTTFTNVNAATASDQYIVSGSGQAAPPSGVFSLPLKTLVTNGVGTPLSGVTVTFTAPASGASGTFGPPANSRIASVVTDGSGNATSPVYTANATTGSYSIPATSSGVTTVNFSAKNQSNLLPVVCNPYAIPVTAANVNDGGIFGPWNLPANCLIATGNGSNIFVGDSTNFGATQILSIRPQAAGNYANIDDDALVSSLSTTFELKAQLLGSSNADFQKATMNGDTPISTWQNVGLGTNNVFVATGVTATGIGTVTGAQIKTGLYGIGFRGFIGSTTAQGSQFNVRAVQQQICYQNRGSFGPESCFTQTIPPTALSLAGSGSGTTIPVWVNPANAITTGGGGSFATVQPFGNSLSGQSQALLFTPQPAGWYSQIQDDALITVVSFQHFYWSSANNGATLIGYIWLNGVRYASTVAVTGVGSASTWVQTAVLSLTIPVNNPFTWAQFKTSGTSGLALQMQQVSGTTTGSVRVNGYTMAICYQNPTGETGTLLFCEA